MFEAERILSRLISTPNGKANSATDAREELSNKKKNEIYQPVL